MALSVGVPVWMAPKGPADWEKLETCILVVGGDGGGVNEWCWVKLGANKVGVWN